MGSSLRSFEWDAVRGTPVRLRDFFSTNSRDLVRRLLHHYGCEGVELIEGDIATLPDAQLPEAIAVCLLDVDLEVPTYEGFRRIFPRLVEGGIILVDDCPDAGHFDGNRRARFGYLRFLAGQGLPERYFLGMGLVNKDLQLPQVGDCSVGT